MMSTGYLKMEELIPQDFLRQPQAVVTEAGNGLGKTECTCQYVSYVQKTMAFERIYYLQYSQKGCENVVRKLERYGAKAVWHVGMEKFCPHYHNYKEYIAMGIPPSYICYLCPFFKGKAKYAFLVFQEQLLDEDTKLVRPTIISKALTKDHEVCTQPIIRSFVLDPTFDIERRAELKETPIVVTPSQLLVNHSVVGRWSRFSRRQRRERRTLMIIDEADTVFFASLKSEVPILEPTREDLEILEEFSTKRRKLSTIINYYKETLELLRKVHEARGVVDRAAIDKMESIKKGVQPYLTTFDRRKREIIKHVLDNKVRTNVFRMVNALNELTHIENYEPVLKTVELHDDRFILQDYAYGVRVLLDVEYPWRYFWKICLTATFPSFKLVESRFLSASAKAILMRSRKRSKGYGNVYVSTYPVYKDVSGPLNRNNEITYSIGEIIKGVKKAVKTYSSRFKVKPRGVVLFTGNSTQYRKLISMLKAHRVKIEERGGVAKFRLGGLNVLLSYAGSPISRGIDLTNYDISFVLAPLLRPPRSLNFLDVIDFGRAVAETVQAAMRIVRSPRPRRPKLVIIERSLTTAFYSHFYPDWFKKLFSESFIELEGENP